MKPALIVVICLLLVGCNKKAPLAFDLVISNVNLIDGTGSPLQQGVSIGVKDGKIAALDTTPTKKPKHPPEPI